MNGEEVIREIRKHTDTVLLSFSCGKDAICAWLALRPHFRVIPYYLYLVPDLQFVERSLQYYEEFFATRIYRLPHASLYRMLNKFVFQAPERCQIIESCELPMLDYDDINALLCEDLHLTIASTFTASGVRAADSPTRHAAVKRFGAINWKRRTFWPIWDWKKPDLRKALTQSGAKLPVDYRIFGRSFDGLDYRFLMPIKQHFPEDYQKILEWFPLADLEIKRREYGRFRPLIAE